MIEIVEVLSSSVWAQEFVHGWTEFRLPLRRAAVDDVAVAVLENWGLTTGLFDDHEIEKIEYVITKN